MNYIDSNTTGHTSGAANAYTSRVPESTPVLVGFVLLYLLFSVSSFVDRSLFFCPFSKTYYPFISTSFLWYKVPFSILGPSWSRYHGSWIYNYLSNQCLSPLKLQNQIPLMARCTRSNVCQWFATSQYFSLHTPVSTTNKADRHDITEILLKVARNTITLTNRIGSEMVSMLVSSAVDSWLKPKTI